MKITEHQRKLLSIICAEHGSIPILDAGFRMQMTKKALSKVLSKLVNGGVVEKQGDSLVLPPDWMQKLSADEPARPAKPEVEAPDLTDIAFALVKGKKK